MTYAEVSKIKDLARCYTCGAIIKGYKISQKILKFLAQSIFGEKCPTIKSMFT